MKRKEKLRKTKIDHARDPQGSHAAIGFGHSPPPCALSMSINSAEIYERMVVRCDQEMFSNRNGSEATHPNAKPFEARDPPFPKFAFMIVIKGAT